MLPAPSGLPYQVAPPDDQWEPTVVSSYFGSKQEHSSKKFNKADKNKNVEGKRLKTLVEDTRAIPASMELVGDLVSPECADITDQTSSIYRRNPLVSSTLKRCTFVQKSTVEGFQLGELSIEQGGCR